MYGFSIIFSLVAFIIVSTSTLVVAGNVKSISNVKTQTNNLDNTVLKNHELSKSQIKALINNVNENDARIVNEQSQLKNKINKVDYETKSRIQNIDTKFRGFKNITNANVVSLTDRINQNTVNINKRLDLFDDNVANKAARNSEKLLDLEFGQSNLSQQQNQTRTELSSLSARTNDQINESKNFASSLHQKNINLIDKNFKSFIKENVVMSDKSKNVLDGIDKITKEKLAVIQNDYKRNDKYLQNIIRNKDNEYKTKFISTEDIDSVLKKTYFDDKPNYNSFNSLISKTDENDKNISNVRKLVSDNDKKIASIQNEYMKDTQLPQKMNDVMKYTDISKDVLTNAQEIERVEQKVINNVQSINSTNQELKQMLKNVKGGLGGDISLNDVTDSIENSTNKLRADNAKQKTDILKSVNMEKMELIKKINENKLLMKNKLTNEVNEYRTAFDTHISDDIIVSKLKDTDVHVSNINTQNATVDGDLIVNGIKFSSLVKEKKEADSPFKPVYDKDFSSAAYIEPNKSVKFNKTLGIEIDEGKQNLNNSTFSMINGNMNLSDTNIEWSGGGKRVNLNANGLNLNDTKVKLKSFKNIQNEEGKTINDAMDDRINQFSTKGSFALQVDDYLRQNDIQSKSLTASELYIGNAVNRLNVKDEIDTVKNDLKVYQTTNMIERNKNFYSKQNPDDLLNEVKGDMKNNVNNYLPNDIQDLNLIKSENVSTKGLNIESDNINSLKVNGNPITDTLDLRYEVKGSLTSELEKLNSRNGVVGIKVDESTNKLVITFSDDTIDSIDLPDYVNRIKTSIATVTVDETANQLKFIYSDGTTGMVDLPKYNENLDLSEYMKRDELDNEFAKKSNENRQVVYLPEEKISRLESIVENDNVVNMKDITSITPENFKKLEDQIQTNTTKLNAFGNLDATMLGKVNLNNLNGYTKENASSSDTFIRLNENVALRANKNRVQMCTNMSADDTMPKNENCYDLWTTKDFIEDEKVKITR